MWLQAALDAVAFAEAWNCDEQPFAKYSATLDSIATSFQEDSKPAVRAAAACTLAAAVRGCSAQSLESRVDQLFAESLVNETSTEVFFLAGECVVTLTVLSDCGVADSA